MHLSPSHSACLTGLLHHTYPHPTHTDHQNDLQPPATPHQDVQFEKKMHFTDEDLRRFLDRNYGEKITGRGILKKLAERHESEQPGIRRYRFTFKEIAKDYTSSQYAAIKHALAQMNLYGLFKITKGGELRTTSAFPLIETDPVGYITQKGIDLERDAEKRDFLKNQFDGGLTGKQILETLNTIQAEIIANHRKTLKAYYETPTGLSFIDQLKYEFGKLKDAFTGNVPPHTLPDEILTYKTYIARFPDAQAAGLKKAMPEMLHLGFFKSTSCEWDYRDQQPLGYNGYIPSEARSFLKAD